MKNLHWKVFNQTETVLAMSSVLIEYGYTGSIRYR